MSQDLGVYFRVGRGLGIKESFHDVLDQDFFFLAVLGMELRSLYLPGRYSTLESYAKP
jgi:hypothetical protein